MHPRQTANLEPATELPPSDAGYQFLSSLGLDAESLGNIAVDGGRPGCTGTLAEYAGVSNHESVREKIEKTVERAHANGEDPAEALIDKMDFVIMRDDDDKIVRVKATPPAQKKT